MPRKTPCWPVRCGTRPRCFNEAAARCRGKRRRLILKVADDNALQ